jgi:hypothetical protein
MTPLAVHGQAYDRYFVLIFSILLAAYNIVGRLMSSKQTRHLPHCPENVLSTKREPAASGY